VVSVDQPRPCCCPTRFAGLVCASCGFRNFHGHEGRYHRGFARVLDPTGGMDLCTSCAHDALSGAEYDTYDVTLVIGVPVVMDEVRR